MRVRFMAVIALAVAGTLLLTGCSSLKSSIDAKLGPKPNIVTQEATVAAVGASVAGTIPASFPKTLPFWPGAKVVKTKVAKTPNGNSFMLTMSAVDPYADVLAGVGKGLTDAGWTVSATDASTPKSKTSILMISGASGEGIVTISQPTSGTVSVEYVLTPKK